MITGTIDIPLGKKDLPITLIENLERVRLLTEKFFVSFFFVLVLYLIILQKVTFYLNTSWGLFGGIYSLVTLAFLFSRLIIVIFYKDDHHTNGNHKISLKPIRYPSVSFVISCKNEESSIMKTIDACLASEYPGGTECIVVNDGSTDRTFDQMIAGLIKYKDKVKVISFLKNLGKREGMSEGVLTSSNEIIVFIDSDSFIKKDSLRYIIQHFIEDPKVGAVSGNTYVENVNVNSLTKMQSARYSISFDIFKAAESVFGTVTCCPGCFSAYRKAAILKVLDSWRTSSFLGTKSTYGDDRSLTNFILRDWKVVYCRKALATTIVPETYKQFFKQQLRWKKSWIREGMFNAGRIMWKKHPIAAISYYISLFVPILGPFVVFKIIFIDFLFNNIPPIFYLNGLIAMGLLFGIFNFLQTKNRNFLYIVSFSIFYSLILVWQMPYAIIKLRNTSWGTR